MYHICKTKSKTHPFQVINVGGNGEVINTSQLLKTKWGAIKNIIANMETVFYDDNVAIPCSGESYCHVQDDTLKKPTAFTLYGTKQKVYNIDAGPKYIPGKNPKKVS